MGSMQAVVREAAMVEGNQVIAKLAAAVTLAITLTTSQCEPPDQNQQPTTKCAEDDPCWDCRTMGDKRCGPGKD